MPCNNKEREEEARREVAETAEEAQEEEHTQGCRGARELQPPVYDARARKPAETRAGPARTHDEGGGREPPARRASPGFHFWFSIQCMHDYDVNQNATGLLHASRRPPEPPVTTHTLLSAEVPVIKNL